MRSKTDAFHLPVRLMANNANRELTNVAATSAGTIEPPAPMTEA